MSALDNTSLKKLIAAKEWDKVEQVIKKALRTDAASAGVNRGEALLNLALVYAEVSNHFQQQHLKRLDQALDLLNKLKVQEAEIDKRAGIAKAKKKISKMK